MLSCYGQKNKSGKPQIFLEKVWVKWNNHSIWEKRNIISNVWPIFDQLQLNKTVATIQFIIHSAFTSNYKYYKYVNAKFIDYCSMRVNHFNLWNNFIKLIQLNMFSKLEGIHHYALCIRYVVWCAQE